MTALKLENYLTFCLTSLKWTPSREPDFQILLLKPQCVRPSHSKKSWPVRPSNLTCLSHKIYTTVRLVHQPSTRIRKFPEFQIMTSNIKTVCVKIVKKTCIMTLITKVHHKIKKMSKLGISNYCKWHIRRWLKNLDRWDSRCSLYTRCSLRTRCSSIPSSSLFCHLSQCVSGLIMASEWCFHLSQAPK